MTTYKVIARRWELGWELHIDGIGVTQVATLASARRVIRDYVAALTGVDPGEIIVDYQIDSMTNSPPRSRLLARHPARRSGYSERPQRGGVRSRDSSAKTGT